MIAKMDLKSNFSILWDPELMKNADKHVQIYNTDVPYILRLHGTKFSGLRSRSRVAFTRQRNFDRDPDRDRKPEFLPA